ncbi:hypothetical protein [Shewanella sp. 4_MG-2023]|uniref:hypothetical protein n=1 Tax=Shewanella sp. 4_MG-2023 TaxID=3062652 RepID=UPI0026E30826|nr:hypothetical protein [Shewanella sp. 4_MG-2023]MDO6677103.1 hypothetical protein [Shewanella sp. 4_MG-2023]
MKVTDQDLEKLFRKANSPELSESEYKSAKANLLSIKSETRLGESKKYGARIDAALIALEHHRPVKIEWYQKPFGLILIGGLGGVFTYGILLSLGWVSMPN